MKLDICINQSLIPRIRISSFHGYRSLPICFDPSFTLALRGLFLDLGVLMSFRRAKQEIAGRQSGEREKERERETWRVGYLAAGFEFTDISEHARYEFCFVRKHGNGHNSIRRNDVQRHATTTKKTTKEKKLTKKRTTMKKKTAMKKKTTMRPRARVPFARKRDARLQADSVSYAYLAFRHAGCGSIAASIYIYIAL